MAISRWLGRSKGSSLTWLLGLGYYTQGFRCFPWIAVYFFFKDVLKADPATLQSVQATVNLPMVAKPIYGIFSDAVYLRGEHRIPYLIIGCSFQMLSWAAIVFLPSASSSVVVIGVFLALSNLGASIAEVVNDALVAECSKRMAPKQSKGGGELQSFAWFAFAVGGVLGNLLGALALSHIEFKSIFIIFMVLVAAQAFVCAGVNETSLGLRSPHSDCVEWNVSEISIVVEIRDGIKPRTLEPPRHPPSTPGGRAIQGQLRDLMKLVKQPELFYPMAWFVASYAMIPTLNGTMFFYQTQHLKVNPMIIGLSKVVGQVGLMIGSAVYSRFLKAVPLRKLVASTQILLSLCMLSDIILVKGINRHLGIPNELMVLGASSFIDAIGQFKLLPFMVLLAHLCPPGNEASLLAFFMSIQCLATIVSAYLGVTLASLLHISSGNFDGLALGIFIEALATLLPLLWISFLPEESKLDRD